MILKFFSAWIICSQYNKVYIFWEDRKKIPENLNSSNKKFLWRFSIIQRQFNFQLQSNNQLKCTYVRLRIFWLNFKKKCFYSYSTFFRENTGCIILCRWFMLNLMEFLGVLPFLAKFFCALSTTRRPVSKFLQFRLIWIHVCLRDLHKKESKSFWSRLFY